MLNRSASQRLLTPLVAQLLWSLILVAPLCAQEPGGASSDAASESDIQRGFNTPELPGPEALPQTGDEPARLTIIKRDRPIEDIFKQINKEAGITVKAMEAVRAQVVTLTAQDKTVEQILNELASSHDWTWIQRQDGTYEMWDKPSFIDKELRRLVIRRIFTLVHVTAADVQPAVDGVKSEVGQIAVNPRTNELIVTDLPDKVALIESIIAEIDVPLYMRTFYIRYADFEQIREPIVALKSQAGTLQFDPLNRRIIVTDTFEKIREIEQLIVILDVDQLMVAYHLSSIGLEGEDAQDLIEKFIEPTVSEGAQVEFFESQSLLVVKDIRDVHDRIMNLLKVLDRSPRMIWIEGEILEVREDFEFELGVEVTYDADLAGAFDDADISLPRASFSSAGLNVLDVVGNAQIMLEAMQRDEQTLTILSPRALVRNLNEVDFDLTQENPQVTTFFNDSQNNNSIRSSSITFVETGLSFTLTPTISNRGLIEMEIDFENSTPVNVSLRTGSADGAVQDAVGRNTQRIRTVLIIPSGETRVLGGLTANTESVGKSGIPLLSSIPYLGALFGGRSESENKRVIYFFLTPTIRQEEPQTELFPVPINEAAIGYIDQLQGRDLILGDPEVPLPEELLQLLDSVRPGAFYENGDGSPSASAFPVPSRPESALPDFSKLLTSAAPERRQAHSNFPFSGPGLTDGLGTAGPRGPSGTLSRATGRVIQPVRPTPAPEPPTAEPTPVPAQRESGSSRPALRPVQPAAPAQTTETVVP